MSDDNDSKPDESTPATPPERTQIQRDLAKKTAKDTEGRITHPRSDN